MLNRRTAFSAFMVPVILMFTGAALCHAEEPAPQAAPAKAEAQQPVKQAPVVGPSEEQRQKAMAPFEAKFKELDEIYRQRYKLGYPKKGLEMARKLAKENPKVSMPSGVWHGRPSGLPSRRFPGAMRKPQRISDGKATRRVSRPSNSIPRACRDIITVWRPSGSFPRASAF